MTAIPIADDDPDIRDLVAAASERVRHGIDRELHPDLPAAAPPVTVPTSTTRNNAVAAGHGTDGHLPRPSSPYEPIGRGAATPVRTRA